jgi:hypothetical protein
LDKRRLRAGSWRRQQQGSANLQPENSSAYRLPQAVSGSQASSILMSPPFPAAEVMISDVLSSRCTYQSIAASMPASGALLTGQLSPPSAMA